MNKPNIRLHLMFVALLLAFPIVAIAQAQQVIMVSRNFAGTGTGDRQSMLFTDGFRHSAQGRYVGFLSSASNLIPNGPFITTPQLYVRDLQTATTQLISADYQTGEIGNCPTSKFEFSKEGRYLAFGSCASNLTPET